MDNCSIRDDVRKELEAVGTETDVVIKTINGSEFHNTTVLTDLVFTDLDGNRRSVLRRQSRDTNRNIKRSVYCQYG